MTSQAKPDQATEQGDRPQAQQRRRLRAKELVNAAMRKSPGFWWGRKAILEPVQQLLLEAGRAERDSGALTSHLNDMEDVAIVQAGLYAAQEFVQFRRLDLDRLRQEIGMLRESLDILDRMEKAGNPIATPLGRQLKNDLASIDWEALTVDLEHQKDAPNPPGLSVPHPHVKVDWGEDGALNGFRLTHELMGVEYDIQVGRKRGAGEDAPMVGSITAAVDGFTARRHMSPGQIQQWLDAVRLHEPTPLRAGRHYDVKTYDTVKVKGLSPKAFMVPAGHSLHLSLPADGESYTVSCANRWSSPPGGMGYGDIILTVRPPGAEAASMLVSDMDMVARLAVEAAPLCDSELLEEAMQSVGEPMPFNEMEDADKPAGLKSFVTDLDTELVDGPSRESSVFEGAEIVAVGSGKGVVVRQDGVDGDDWRLLHIDMDQLQASDVFVAGPETPGRMHVLDDIKIAGRILTRLSRFGALDQEQSLNMARRLFAGQGRIVDVELERDESLAP